MQRPPIVQIGIISLAVVLSISLIATRHPLAHTLGYLLAVLSTFGALLNARRAGGGGVGLLMSRFVSFGGLALAVTHLFLVVVTAIDMGAKA
ncbi:MAG: hypothetical protein OEY23_18240 [Acidimicrobiia bacterium]|nr:hypothetical protein [Acidimicrobiia bacterium]